MTNTIPWEEQKMKKCLRVFELMALIGIFILSVHGSSSAQNVKIVKIAFGQTMEHPMGVGAQAFAKALAEKTNNRFSAQLFPLGTLGSERENAESVQMGAIQVALIPSGFSPTFAPDTALIILPYLFKNREHYYKALDGAGGEELAKTWPKGFKVLGYYENAGFRQVTNSVRPIKVPEDYKGLKIRVMDNPVQIAALKKLGAGPTPMTIGEVYMALQQKVVDGQENPLANIYTTKFYEVQKYCSMVKMFMDITSFAVNEDFFNGLSKDDQAIFIEAMKVGREAGRRFSEKMEQEYATLLKAKGMEINEVDIEPFSKALRPVWAEFIKTDRQKKIVDLLTNPK
jgi:tripartite ATP-independent transporter DctP family solute receptor